MRLRTRKRGRWLSPPAAEPIDSVAHYIGPDQFGCPYNISGCRPRRKRLPRFNPLVRGRVLAYRGGEKSLPFEEKFNAH